MRNGMALKSRAEVRSRASSNKPFCRPSRLAEEEGIAEGDFRLYPTLIYQALLSSFKNV